MDALSSTAMALFSILWVPSACQEDSQARDSGPVQDAILPLRALSHASVLPSAPPFLAADSARDEEPDRLLGPWWTFGPRVGYVKARDADRGTWLGGLQLRLHLSDAVALEGAISFHQDRFADGDALVTFYPVEVSALVFPLPLPTLKPYGMAGVGWYYSRVDYKDILSVNNDETVFTFGAHVGLGAQLQIGSSSMLNADLRYIFLEPDFDAIEDEKFDSIQFTAGLNFDF
ncbi:MAG: porin family protein [Planctomycetes bacterium]|nr:porin family protein [Planctomycetota bacterium]